MRLKISIALTGLFLVGCSDSDVRKLQAPVRARLVDPESARFGDAIFNREMREACIEYNAKNRMGGYNGQKIAYLRVVRNEWEVGDMDATQVQCPNNGKVVKG